jgi:hypothetical protein
MKKALLFAATTSLLFAACKKDLKEPQADLQGLNAGVQAVIPVSGVINTSTTWTAGNVYQLNGKVYVSGGATLTIQPGARVEGLYNATPENASALVITKTGRIVAKGQQSNPIIFTSSLDGLPGGRTTRLPGDWGGLVILGDAPTNKPATQFIEGINPATVPAGVDVTYGGSNINHDGGIISFARIEFAGAAIAPNNELNSLTLGGVGKKTGLRYIMCSNGADDAFEFFGGNVQPKYLVANSQNDDAFDFDFGYTGDIQFGISVRNPALAYNDANGIECDNDAASSTAAPITRPILSNFTIVGKADAALAGTLNGARWRRGTDLRFRNSIVMGYNTGTSFENTNPTNAAAFYRSNATHGFTTVANFVGTSVAPIGLGNLTATGTPVPADWVNNPAPAAHSGYKSSALVYKAGGALDPSGGLQPNFNNLTTNFLQVPYVGALGPGSPIRNASNQIIVPNNWIAGSAGAWVDFDPS